MSMQDMLVKLKILIQCVQKNCRIVAIYEDESMLKKISKHFTTANAMRIIILFFNEEYTPII